MQKRLIKWLILSQMGKPSSVVFGSIGSIPLRKGYRAQTILSTVEFPNVTARYGSVIHAMSLDLSFGDVAMVRRRSQAYRPC